MCCRVTIIVDAALHGRHLPSSLASELLMDEANDSGFFSIIRVCMVSYRPNETTGSSLIGAQFNNIDFSADF